MKDMVVSQTPEQEVNAVNKKKGSKRPKAPKENGKGSKDQLSAEWEYCQF